MYRFPTTADSVPSAWSTPAAHGESISGHYQRYTLNRVAHVIASQKEEPDSLVESTYSYDPHGNVEWVRQELPLLGSNWVEYSYDLLSGNMLEMRYNPGWRDALWHRYFYDEDNRLTEVKTSREGEIWDSDARYSYYAHGPLKRAEYGEDSLQGIDYTYTLQGWLKGINHPQGAVNLSGLTGGPTAYGYDPGGDQAGNRTNYAPDAFGMTLRYHEGDFYRIGSAFHSEESTADAAVAATNLPAIVVNGSATDLYNGNISTWTSHTVAAGGQVDETLTGHRYQYDVLNRLRLSRYEMWNGTSVAPQGLRYRSVYTYDPNGNIQTLVRFGNGTTAFDDFAYTYPSSGSNRLSQVSDAAPGPTAVPGDLEGGQGSNNYTYDASGNLIGDAQELISSGGIEWRADGKVWRVTKTGGVPDELKFSYNASGDRVIKKVSENGEERRLFYVREAGGKVLAIYEQVCPAPMVGPSGPNIDWDGDGQVGTFDPCPCEAPLDPNLGHLDADEDGVPDECDPNPTIPGDQPSTDHDGDGNEDDHDNCMCTANPSESGANGPQTDSDGDGFGDECDPGCEIVLIELHIYGNGSEGRIAISQPSGITRSGLRGDTSAIDIAVQPLPPLPPVPPVWVRDSILTRVLDEKVYELKDHLGNVRVVISDVKEPVSQSGAAPFGVTLRRYTNYYPFGMAQPGRSYAATAGGEYRYGYNNAEIEKETYESNLLVTEHRRLDPRIARWWSLDPMVNNEVSGYVSMGNSPIIAADPEGLEPVLRADTWGTSNDGEGSGESSDEESNESLEWEWFVREGDTYSEIAQRVNELGIANVTAEQLEEWNEYRPRSIPIHTTLRLSPPESIERAAPINLGPEAGEMNIIDYSGSAGEPEVYVAIGVNGSVSHATDPSSVRIFQTFNMTGPGEVHSGSRIDAFGESVFFNWSTDDYQLYMYDLPRSRSTVWTATTSVVQRTDEGWIRLATIQYGYVGIGEFVGPQVLRIPDNNHIDPVHLQLIDQLDDLVADPESLPQQYNNRDRVE